MIQNDKKSKTRKKIKGEFFCLAIRKKSSKSECSLFETKKEFFLIDNPPGRWVADPFLIDVGDTTLIFAEIFSNFTGKGSLYCCYVSWPLKKVKWKKCSVEKCHLSFPNVFILGDDFYMIPETSELNSVSLYKGSPFPFKWVKEKSLLQGYKCVDSILLKNSLVTYELGNPYNKLLFIDKDGNLKGSFADFDNLLRPAGNIIVFNNQTYLITQNCKNAYGESIIINIFKNDSIQKVKDVDVKNFKIKTKRHFTGMHTYNSTDNYEIIDLKYNKFSLLRILGKPFRFIFKTRK